MKTWALILGLAALTMTNNEAQAIQLQAMNQLRENAVTAKLDETTKASVKRAAAAALKEIETLISKAGAQLGAMAPVLIADLKLLEGRYLLLKRKKKKAIASMRASLDYAKEQLKDRPVAIGMLQCQLAQTLEKLKKGKGEIPRLRSEGIENLKTAFNEDHPAHESCQKGTLPW